MGLNMSPDAFRANFLRGLHVSFHSSLSRNRPHACARPAVCHPISLSQCLTQTSTGLETKFDEFVGHASCGTALRCRAEKKILKFGAPDGILHEALMYSKLAGCGNLAVPRYWGLHPLRTESSEQLAIILDDVGVPIDIEHMTRRQW